MQHSNNFSFPYLDAQSLRIGIVQAVFNKDITDAMVKCIIDDADSILSSQSKGQTLITKQNITVTKVAGAVEIPLVLQTMASSDKFDILVAIGCVIRGDTPHFDYVCKIVSEGVLRVMLDNDIPVGFGLITTENHAQAVERIATAKSTLDAVINQYNEILKLKNGKGLEELE
jgi:6,7-dimethyl-8-ribityllumazine synthase